MQPAHLPGDVPLAESRWGPRPAGPTRFGACCGDGTVLAFGSDVPVASLDPREGVQAAMTRVAGDGSFPPGGNRRSVSCSRTRSRVHRGNAIAGGSPGAAAHGTRLDADLVAWEVDPAVSETMAERSAMRGAAHRDRRGGGVRGLASSPAD